MSAQIITVGELLVEFVSHKKNCALSSISDFSGPYPSGAPAIFVDQAARIGAKTAIFGGVGDDGFGTLLLDRLNSNGVNTNGVAINNERSTGVAFVSYFDDGARVFIFHIEGTAADDFLVSTNNFKSKKNIMHVSASSLGNAKLRDMIVVACNETIASGGQLSCDPNVRPELMRDDAAMEVLDDIMRKCTYLLPSTSDLGHLFPDLSEEAAISRLLSYSADIIAVKRGSAGALVVSGDDEHAFAAHQVDELDPTGAGDCFCGTFMSLLTQGYSLEDAGRYANAAGAMSVIKRGPMEGNSNFAEISDFLQGACPTSSVRGVGK